MLVNDCFGFLQIVDRLARFSKIAGEIRYEQLGERLGLLYTQPEITPRQVWQRLSNTGLPRRWIPKRENTDLVDASPPLGNGKLDLRGAKSKAIELAIA